MKYFITIGEELENCSKKFAEKEECLKYMEFLDAKEILILRKVVSKVTAYSYTGEAETCKIQKIDFRISKWLIPQFIFGRREE